MKKINIKSFRSKAYRKRGALTKFMNRLQKKAPKGVDAIARKLNDEVWQEVECLSCANCCKTMTPTFTKTDIKRISAHLKMTPKAFYDKWLTKEEDSNDIINKSTPCQFLNKDNKCSIYEVRPRDCSGFPHFSKKDVLDYTHVYTENIHRCPATLLWVEKMEKSCSHLLTTKK